MKKQILPVVFRYNKKYDYVEMFYLEGEGLRQQITCFTMEEGHGTACYDYYLSTTPIKNVIEQDGIKERVERIKNYYESDSLIELKVMQKLFVRNRK